MTASASRSATGRSRPYATLLAKGEDRKQRILTGRRAASGAQRLAQYVAGADRQRGGRDSRRACCTTSSPRSSCSTRCSMPATPTTTPTPTVRRRPDHRDLPGRRALRPRARTRRDLHRAAGREHLAGRTAARPLASPAPRARSTSSPTSSGVVNAPAATTPTSTRPPRPSRSSPSSMEWRPHGCSILRYPWRTCSRGTASIAGTSRRGGSIGADDDAT